MDKHLNKSTREANGGTPIRHLSAAHAAMLAESAISPEVMAQRGYLSMKSAAELRRLGFGERQARAGLLIPVWGVVGEIVNYQLRPDAPRIVDGKPLKYETPKGSRMALDVPPGCRAMIGDPTKPLFITEGVKKADAAVSHELCCIALLGVWNWRGTNEQGGTVALPDWESITLKDRKVYVVFDSDVMEKAPVYAALCRLKAFLESRGAQVLVVYLPPGPSGTKVGLDDYLAAGHTIAEMLAHATSALRRPPADPDEEGGPYRETPAGLVWKRTTRDGAVTIPLTNFTAKIVADVLRDDGAETTRMFEIELAQQERHARCLVPATRFQSMTWAIEHFGAQAVIYPGSGGRDHAAAAVQLLSGGIRPRIVYAHTGWRLIDNAPLYLHADGAIGATGTVSGIEVDLSGKLGRYRLPAPPTDAACVEAVRASLDLLQLGPLGITVPLFACAYLAPLSALLDALRPDFVVWLVGGSGLFKSELAALVQAHFGDFTRLTLPANFEATANSIERTLFTAKDAVVVVDDYHPAGDPRQAQAMATTASRLLRGVGNGAGRSRMQADTSLRPDLPPRALAVATGERLPTGHSNLARLFPVPCVSPGIDVGRLTTAQRQIHLLPSATAAYVQWIATHWDALAIELPTRFTDARDDARQSGGHRREPGQVAHLFSGLTTFLRFAVEMTAIDMTTAAAIEDRAWQALREIAAEQAIQLADETPVQRFLALLADGFVSRRIYIEGEDGGAPLHAERWGWQRTASDDDERASFDPGRAVLVGRVKDDDWLCLYPEVTDQYISSAARAANQVFPVEQKTLLKQLAEAGLIAEQCGRRTVKVRFGDANVRVIKLLANALHPPSDEREHREQRERQGSRDEPELLLP